MRSGTSALERIAALFSTLRPKRAISHSPLVTTLLVLNSARNMGQSMELAGTQGQNNNESLPPCSLQFCELELTAIERHEPAMLTPKPCTYLCCRVTEDVALRIISELHRGFKSVANVGG
jgi:hypothetical protein